MARISYVDESTHPQLARQIETIRAGRRGKLIPVYGLLLHNPDIAMAWMALLDAVRWHTRIDPSLREMVILRVATLNHCDYVIDVHARHFVQHDGLAPATAQAVLAREVDTRLLDARQQAVVRYVDEVTLQAQAAAGTLEALKPFFDEGQILELTVLVGAYNMHTRVMSSLGIDAEGPDGPTPPVPVA